MDTELNPKLHRVPQTQMARSITPLPFDLDDKRHLPPLGCLSSQADTQLSSSLFTCCGKQFQTIWFFQVPWHAGQEGEERGRAEQPEGPFQVSLQYNGPAVLLWLWSNARSSENTGLKAYPIKHTAGNSGTIHNPLQLMLMTTPYCS